jgi:hypothetical protein
LAVAQQSGWLGVGALPRRAANAITADASGLGVSRTAALFWAIAPIVLAGGVGLAAFVRPIYRWLILEDGPIEWLQVGLLAVLAVLGVLIGARLLMDRRVGFGLVYLAGAVAAAFILGEEISWGQRIFGWATPEELEELNRQGETNIHNIGTVLLAFNLVMMVSALLAAVVPMVWYRMATVRRRSATESLFIPPLFLVPGFALAFAYRFLRFVVAPEPGFTISRYQEVTELIFYLGMTVFVYLVWRQLRVGATSDQAGARASAPAPLGR